MIGFELLESPIDISIPLKFNQPQPNAYGVQTAMSKPVEAGELVGDTRLGGSVNFEQYTFIPHCNGTHTECVGHITHERISVRDCVQDVLMKAVLLSVTPEHSDESDDPLITATAIASAFESEKGAATTGFPSGLIKTFRPPADAGDSDQPMTIALIVRTLPNDDGKLTRQYGEVVPPYFTTEAMQYIVDCGFKHLLVDLPSIDRLFDEGKLSNHRIFWNVEPGSFETNESTRINSSITELIYVPNEVEDGNYILNLQIAPFESDCAPSRPLLFRIN
ncbi:MAG: cyclase family protein [Blastocatellia bacterium]